MQLMKRLIPILLISLALAGCGKESAQTAPEQAEPTVSAEKLDDKLDDVPTDSSAENSAESPAENSSENSTESSAENSKEMMPADKSSGILGAWKQTDPDEEITGLTFGEGTYTYQYDYSRAYEPGEEIDEDPVSGENGPFNYFLDEEYVIELEDTVLTQINMSMDDELSSYGNCGIYDEKGDCIYIGDSFNNLLMTFIQQGYTTQKEWIEYIEDEFYLMFVR